MSEKKKDYQRQWVARKRALHRVQKKLNVAGLYSSESDSSSDAELPATSRPCPDYSMPLQSFSTKTGEISELCDSASDASSDEQPSSDSNWDWYAVDEMCDRFSDSSDCEDEMNGPTSLKAKLRTWAVDTRATYNQLDALLPILREYESTLPLTGKTLMKINDDVSVKVSSLSGGEYIYIGLSAGLTDAVRHSSNFTDVDTLELTLNVDGLPLFKSSAYTLWPVLCCTANLIPQHVFPVALYGGKAKPNNLDFLQETVGELKHLLTAGTTIDGKIFECKLKFCMCDAPARAMVKCMKQFSGYYGCDKCCQKGEYVGRMTYPECEALLRDDKSFRCQLNSEHHNGLSPFCDLQIDMVSCFPVDYMHQVCLGVMKRLLVCWTGGCKKVKLSVIQKAAVDMKLASFRHVVTSNFSRKPRSLTELSHWKATEFRTFLLYLGYFALYKIVNDDILSHFLSLSIAMRIFASERLSADTDYVRFAHDLLLYFVSHAADIYGREFLVYNVHSLVHLRREVELFGKIDNCSAFVFENYLSKLKKFSRSGKNPLVQVSRRLREYNLYRTQSTSDMHNPNCELQSLTSAPPDNCCILASNGRCCQVISKSEKQVTCMVYTYAEPVYSQPLDSRSVGIYKVRRSNGFIKHLPANTPVHKALCYTEFSADNIVFIELLHVV